MSKTDFPTGNAAPEQAAESSGQLAIAGQLPDPADTAELTELPPDQHKSKRHRNLYAVPML